jgi:adenylate cyclase
VADDHVSDKEDQDGSRLGAEMLEEAFLGEAAHLTREQVEATATNGFPSERVRSLWRALGFVDPAPGELRFTEADVDALRLSQRLSEDELIGAGITESVARTVGQAMSRLAEAQTQIVTEQLAADPALAKLAQEHPEELVRQVSDRFAHLLPELEWLIAYAWRRHMLAAVQRAVAGAAHDLSDHTVAIGFCDIVGYTSAVRDMTSHDLSELVGTFEQVASDIIIAHDGRVVKTLGDEVMFMITDPVQAAITGLALADAFGQDDALVPPVRVGLAFGATLAHAGDIFGPVVNLASRCTGIARPGSVVADRELATRVEEAIAERPELKLSVSRLRTFRVRGYGHLAPYVIRHRH